MARRMRDEQEAEESLKLMKMNLLKKQYPELRNNFLESFKVLYCRTSMNDPYLNKLFKTKCNHKHTEVNYEHYEMVMYIKNIIAWLDPKMDYCDDNPTTRSIPRFKTSFIHDEKHVSRVCLHKSDITEPRSSKIQSTCDSGTSENILDSTKVNKLSVMNKFKKKSNSISRKRNQNNINDVGVTSESIPDSTEVNEPSDTKKFKKKSYSISRKRKQNNIIDVRVTSENILDSTEVVNEPSDMKKFKKKSNSISQKTKQNNINDVGVTSENIFDSTEVDEPSDMKKFKKKSNSISQETNQNNINDVRVTSENILDSTEVVNEPSVLKKFKKKSNSISQKTKQNNINDVGVTSENIFDSTEVDEPSDMKKFKKKSNSISQETNQNNINDVRVTSENILDSTEVVNEPSDMKKFKKKSNSISQKTKQNNINDVGVTSENIFDSTEVDEPSDMKKFKKKSNSISQETNQNNINDVRVTSENILDSTEVVNEPSDMKKFKKKSNSISQKTKQNIINDVGITSENIFDSTEADEPSDMKKFQKKSNSISQETNQNNINDVSSNSDKISNDSTKMSITYMYRINKMGETYLHDPCRKGELDVVTNLLNNGFNPNVKDNVGWTPLHEAVKNGHYQIVKKLIDYGAYINVPGFEYETPLHTALYCNNFDIALLLYHNGADVACINMYGINLKSLNNEIWTKLITSEIPYVPSRTKYVYEPDRITMFMYKVSLTNDAVKQFCKKFNIKLVQNLLRLKGNQLKQVTHIILPKMENNVCDVNMETLTGIANGLFLVNERWVSDSLEQNKLLSCENYEVSGTKNYVDYNGPKISRINKEKLYPKLFDGLSIHLFGSVGWESFSLEQLQELIVKFGAKFLYRMPSPENCTDNIFPYHFRTDMEMCKISTIVLYTIDSNRLIKYNMKHLKAFPISWFMEAIQKYTIP